MWIRGDYRVTGREQSDNTECSSVDREHCIEPKREVVGREVHREVVENRECGKNVCGGNFRGDKVETMIKFMTIWIIEWN